MRYMCKCNTSSADTLSTSRIRSPNNTGYLYKPSLCTSKSIYIPYGIQDVLARDEKHPNSRIKDQCYTPPSKSFLNFLPSYIIYGYTFAGCSFLPHLPPLVRLVLPPASYAMLAAEPWCFHPDPTGLPSHPMDPQVVSNDPTGIKPYCIAKSW